MLRTRLLTASAAMALIAAPAFAQDPTNPPPDPVPPTAAPGEQPAPTDPAVQGPVAQPQSPPADVTAAPPPAAGGTVVDVLRAEGQFNTLLELLDAAQLTEVLRTDPDITILAPTDAAFAALPAGELDRLRQPQNVQALRDLLLYHVINADVRADQVLNRRGGVQTGGGAEIMLDGSGGTIRADNATVTRHDLRGGNGAVFVLDQVLAPSASQAQAAPVQAPPEPPASAPEAPPAEAAPPPGEMTPTPDPDPGAAPPESPAAAPVEEGRPPAESPPIDPDPDGDDLDEPDGPDA